MVLPSGRWRWPTAPEPGLIHHVVVVEAADVGQLDHQRGADDVVEPRRPAVRTELGGEHHQQRAEPLPPAATTC